MERKYSLYIHTFPNGKMYVGITSVDTDKRWLNGSGYKKGTIVRNAILKYGWGNIQHDIIFSDLTREEACSYEILTIAYFQTTNTKYGYNMNSGGDAKIPTKETLIKMTGKNHWNYGNKGLHKRSKETREKISKSKIGEKHYLFGKHLSDEHRKNVSISQSGEKNGFYGKKHKEGIFTYRRRPIYQVDLETNEIIKCWNSAWEIEETLGYGHSAIAACCRGKYKTSRGYLWKYAN